MTKEQINEILVKESGDEQKYLNVITDLSDRGINYIVLGKSERKKVDPKQFRFNFDNENELLYVYPGYTKDGEFVYLTDLKTNAVYFDIFSYDAISIISLNDME